MDTKSFNIVCDYVVSDIESILRYDDFHFPSNFTNHLTKILYYKSVESQRLCEDAIRELLLAAQDGMFWEVVRLICKFRKPISTHRYCMAEVEAGSQLSFYSVADYREGKEVRVPRLLTADQAISFKARYDVSIVIERPYEAQAWLLRWEGKALLAGAVLPGLIEQYE